MLYKIVFTCWISLCFCAEPSDTQFVSHVCVTLRGATPTMSSHSNQMGASGYDNTAQNLFPVLQALQQAGKLDDVLQQVVGDSAKKSPPMTTHGAMTDGSKRRMTSPMPSVAASEDWELAGMSAPGSPPGWAEKIAQGMSPPASLPGWTEKMNQEPVHPKAGSLPPDMHSMSDWSRTICELPKASKVMGIKDPSYAAMVKSAETDKDVRQYLIWVMNHPEVSVRVKDFSNYLKAVRFDLDPDRQPKMYFSGSSEVRRLKWRLFGSKAPGVVSIL